MINSISAPKNLFKKIAVVITLCLFLLSYVPVPAHAALKLTFDVDKPNSVYISGKDKVTFTINNTGQDIIYVDCNGILVGQLQANGQTDFITQEMHSCYVLAGANVPISYEVDPGQTHTWQWDQKDDVFQKQAPNGKNYYGEIVVYTSLVTGASNTYTTSYFSIDSNGDGDGVPDSQDMCPQTAGTGSWGSAVGCPDYDNDGIPDKKDDGSQNGFNGTDACPGDPSQSQEWNGA